MPVLYLLFFFLLSSAFAAETPPSPEELIKREVALREKQDAESHAAPDTQAIVNKILNNVAAETPANNAEPADLLLNFKDVSLASIVTYLTEQKKLNIISDKGLESIKDSLQTEVPYTLTQALGALHTLLEKNGFCMTESAGIYRIVPVANVSQQPLITYSSKDGVEPEDLPTSDMIVRYLYYLKNTSTPMLRDILISMLGDKAVAMLQDLDVFVLTAKSNNIKSAMKIIKELDQGGLRQSIKIIKLQHTDPEAIARLFNEEIMGQKREAENIRFIAPSTKKDLTYFSTSTKVIADPPRQALVLMGQEQDIDRIIEFAYLLDKPADAEESRLLIRDLKYIEADKAKALIERSIRAPQGTTDKQVLSEFKFFEDVVVAAETPKMGDQTNYGCGNRLIIACNKQVRPALNKLIDALDKKYPQVAFEMMFVDVTQKLAKELSTQFRNKTPGQLGPNIAYQAAHAADVSNQTVTPLNSNLASLINSGANRTSEFTLGNPGTSFENGNIWLYVRSLLTEDQTNILSQPFLVANNREPCSITSNVTRRVAGDFVASSGVRASRAQVDLTANTVVNITPRINADGIIDLTIKISISEFLPTEANADQPGRQIRTLETRASMGEGQVLVLGGLTRSAQTQNFWHTPGFASVPILGNLFKGRSRNHDKQNLFIFIRPSIIKPRYEGNPDDYTQLKMDYAKYQVLNVDGYSGSKDPIQRWFFKPRNQSIKQRMSDLKNGIFRPIDDFKEGKETPREVDIKTDPYYQSELKAKLETEKSSTKKVAVNTPPPPPLVFRNKPEQRRSQPQQKEVVVSENSQIPQPEPLIATRERPKTALSQLGRR